MQNRKIAHLHLKDYSNNKYTLICRIKNGSMNYILYSGWSSSGMPNSLSNLQCNLPMFPNPNETEEKFVDRIVDTINRDSVKYVEKRIPVEVTFAQA